MGDPGNPTDPSGTSGSEPDPGQPGWASPTPPAPPPPPPPAQPTPSSFGTPPPTVPGVAPVDSDWQPPPPAVKKRRLTWLWILIPVLLVFVTSVVLIAVFAVRAIVGPIEATDDYFTALHDENYSEAYDLRCAAFKAQITEEDFTRREQVNGPVGDFDFNGFDRTNDSATTEGDVTRSGVNYRVTIRLEKEGDDWKVCEIRARRR
jgi:hypothetical protein